MKILILCTGNSCRSQMAEGFLKALNEKLIVFSAGTSPTDRVHPKAVEVMDELGVDISKSIPKSVTQFLNHEFDYVITVCDDAKENCPLFTGKVKYKLHFSFEDPAKTRGTNEYVLRQFKQIRDEILRDFFAFNQKYIKKNV